MIGKKLLLRELVKLEQNGIITGDTSERIRAYYNSSEKPKTIVLLIIFGILGTLLIGSGIILLLAHNWDDLPRWVRTIISLAPLVAAQSVCGYAILKKQESIAWRESTTVFLFCAVGAGISLISQTYNIYGDFGRFILVWSLLILPVIYLFDAVTVSIFYLAWVGLWTGHQVGEHLYPWLYWPLAGAIIPFGYRLYKNAAHSMRFTLFSWAATIFATATLPMLFSKVTFIDSELILPLAYVLLFLLLYLVGHTSFYDQKSSFANPGSLIGSLGIIVLLLIVSFEDVWKYYQKHQPGKITAWEDIAGILLLAGIFVSIIILFLRHMKNGRRHVVYYSLSLIAIGFGYLIFFINIPIIFIQFIINSTLLAIGIATIVRGVKQDNLPATNFGMAIISVLILCRFLDSDLSFIIRGIGFIAVGIGFLASNYFLMRKNKNEK